MKALQNLNTQYIFAIIFTGVGVYQIYRADWLEAILYFLAAITFVLNNLASAPKFAQQKKLMVVIIWVLMIVITLLFLWLLQFKYL